MELCPICNSKLDNILNGVNCKNGCYKERQIIDVDYFYHYINILGKENIVDIRGCYVSGSEYCERLHNNMMNMVNAIIKSEKSN